MISWRLGSSDERPDSHDLLRDRSTRRHSRHGRSSPFRNRARSGRSPRAAGGGMAGWGPPAARRDSSRGPAPPRRGGCTAGRGGEEASRAPQARGIVSAKPTSPAGRPRRHASVAGPVTATTTCGPTPSRQAERLPHNGEPSARPRARRPRSGTAGRPRGVNPRATKTRRAPPCRRSRPPRGRDEHRRRARAAQHGR